MIERDDAIIIHDFDEDNDDYDDKSDESDIREKKSFYSIDDERSL